MSSENGQLGKNYEEKWTVRTIDFENNILHENRYNMPVDVDENSRTTLAADLTAHALKSMTVDRLDIARGMKLRPELKRLPLVVPCSTYAVKIVSVDNDTKTITMWAATNDTSSAHMMLADMFADLHETDDAEKKSIAGTFTGVDMIAHLESLIRVPPHKGASHTPSDGAHGRGKIMHPIYGDMCFHEIELKAYPLDGKTMACVKFHKSTH